MSKFKIFIERKEFYNNKLKSEIDSVFIDVSKDSTSPYKIFNPNYCWGRIPLPYKQNIYKNRQITAESLNALWEGLKVFENCDIDISWFKSSTNGARVENEKSGKFIGIKRGIYGDCVFSEEEARERVYIPTYKWILENRAYEFVLKLRNIRQYKDIVIIDDNTNCNIKDCEEPLSTGFLLKAYIEGSHPYEDIVIVDKEYHTYIGRNIIQWCTYKRTFKEIPPIENIIVAPTLEFDY